MSNGTALRDPSRPTACLSACLSACLPDAHSLQQQPLAIATFLGRILDSQHVGTIPTFTKTLLGQFVARWIRSHFFNSRTVLDRLPGYTGSGTVCCPRLWRLLCIEYNGQVAQSRDGPRARSRVAEKVYRRVGEAFHRQFGQFHYPR